MKKTFKLQVENKDQDRVIESIKNEIRKYIKREKRKALPEGKDFWFFDCKFAKDEETPKEIAFSDIIKFINEADNEKCKTFYLEILARAEKKPEKEEEKTLELESEDENSLQSQD